MSKFIERPNQVKAFASKTMQGDYLPVRFATNIVDKNLEKIANDNFEYGLESLEGDLQLKDLNTVLYYQGALTKYLFERGVAEFSAYQSYPSGSVVTHNGGLWIATQEIKASLKQPNHNCVPCSPCGDTDTTVSLVCGDVKEPSTTNGWCRLITSCEYEPNLKSVTESLIALQTGIDNLKGVAGFAIANNLNTGKPELVLTLSDGSQKVIDMSKFGGMTKNQDGTLTIKNPDGSVVELPKFLPVDALDASRGFLWNPQTNKLEIDLADLLRSGGNLMVDRGGNISIDPAYTQARDKFATDKAAEAKAGAIRETKQDLANTGSPVKLNPNSGLLGEGTNADPLRLNHSNQFELINGVLHLKPNHPKRIHDLNTLSPHLRQVGFTMFTAFINKTSGDYVVGVPADVKAEGEQAGTTALNQITNDYGGYDYNGWQIASATGVTQYISENGITWTRENDLGMNNDGSLVNPHNWSNWRRVDNINVSTAQVNNLVENTERLSQNLNNLQQANQAQQQTIQDLQRRLQALEKPCEVAITNAGSITVNNNHNVIVSNGGTVTFPNNLTVGRSFTVVRSGNGEVTLAGVISPDGMKISGENKAVTVIVTSAGQNRAFGSVKP